MERVYSTERACLKRSFAEKYGRRDAKRAKIKLERPGMRRF
jgi:hypothetical protein